MYVSLKLLDVHLTCTIELSEKKGGIETDVNPHAKRLCTIPIVGSIYIYMVIQSNTVVCLSDN